MKKLNFLLVIIAFISVSFPTYSQYFGVQGGLNISSMYFEDDDDDDAKAGIHLGGTYEYQMTDEFVLQTGLLFSMKGAKWDSEFGSGKISLSYFDIPINVAYKFKVEDVYVFGISGPVIGLGLSGKYKSTWENFSGEEETETDDVEWGSGDSDDFRRLDLGWKFGAGVQFMEQFQASLSYTTGIANIYSDSDYTVRNNVFQISFAIFFEELY